MNKGFASFDPDELFIYLDDLIPGAEEFEEFLSLLRRVLSNFRRLKLTCKREKCGFGLRELTILGHIWSRAGLKMSDDRKKPINAIPFPRTVHELRRFLGMTNYQRMFIPRYSILAKTLSSQVNTPIAQWNRKDMHRAFVEQAHLTHLDYSLPIVLQTDGSILGIAAMLANRLPSGLFLTCAD